MYKIIRILLWITVLNIQAFSEVTDEDVDSYLHVSRGGALVKHIFSIRYKTYFPTIYTIDIRNADEVTMHKYIDFIYNSKYIDDFNKVIGQLDDNTYFEIMAFYETKLGQKYAQAFTNLYENGTAETLFEYMKQEKDKILLENKRKLVVEISKSLYCDKVYIATIFIDRAGKDRGKDKIQESKKVNKQSREYEVDLKEYFVTLSAIAYKDFTDDELLKLLKYTKTYGKIEMKFLYKAVSVHNQHFFKDLHKLIEKERLKRNPSN